MASRTAIILGASGSVGQALLAEVVNSGGFGRIARHAGEVAFDPDDGARRSDGGGRFASRKIPPWRGRRIDSKSVQVGVPR
jgi:hypothetical protein